MSICTLRRVELFLVLRSNRPAVYPGTGGRVELIFAIKSN